MFYVFVKFIHNAKMDFVASKRILGHTGWTLEVDSFSFA